MIFFYGEGRLGNQIFQYQALNSLARKRERVIAVGLEELTRVFELSGPRIRVLTHNGTLKRIVKYVLIPLLLRPLARGLRLTNYVAETRYQGSSRAGSGGEFATQAGLIRSLTFVDGGHYQNAALWRSKMPTQALRVERKLRDEARKFLSEHCGERTPAFVHIRRGDYLHYVNFGLSNLTLPAEFYQSAIERLRAQVPDAHLVFVTDDPGWVEQTFTQIDKKSVASFRPELDFAIMTECRCGIMSNSSYSLAAALMLENPRLLIGPKYWFGFRVAEWLPPHIEVRDQRVSYLPVSA